LEFLMKTSQNFLVRCGIRMLLGASMIVAAVAAMLLGWVITAQASAPMPGAGERGESPVLCATDTPSCAPCSPDAPLFMTKPATLRPEKGRTSRKH
jgi:hypothetical protein